MKKSLKCLVAATASVISTGAIAANLENPLYMPKSNEAYIKVGAAIMGKSVEGTQATNRKHRGGDVEFPVWRFTGDLGYGITDRLDVHGRFGYTKDGEIDRKGMHRGRLGLTFRALTEDYPVIWDLYADAYLSGLTPMKGTYKLYDGKGAFDFGNYSNGRWGAIVGTRFGKTWDKFTLAAHIEYLQTFGNHNNKIKLDIPALAGLFQTDELSVDLRSTHEATAGFDMMYQANEKWSFGAGFEYVEHYNNGVKSIHTQLPNNPYVEAKVQQLLAETNNMKDGWDEYIFKINAAYQMTEALQLATFFEYTFDDAQPMSQNATDFKMELGVRLNAKF